jgi:hypothetical protein
MNYTTLVANIQDFLEDDSTELTNSIDQIIDQAETMIFQRLPNLPCFRKITTDSLVAGTAEYTIASCKNDPSGMRMSHILRMRTWNLFLSWITGVDSYVRDYWPNPLTYDNALVPTMYSTNSAGTTGTVIMLAPTPAIQASDAENTIPSRLHCPRNGVKFW